MSDAQGKLPAGQALPRAIAAWVPFYYGWIVLACLCCAGFARQGPAVATLSIFVEPLTREFGWSRTALSGAVSLGGLLAALVSPLIGPLLDRRGSRLVYASLSWSTASPLLLSLTRPLVFYLLFCIARMNWAGPFDLGSRRAEQLVSRAPDRRGPDRHLRADARTGSDAADRAVRHIA